MFYLHIKTLQKRLGHMVMIFDQQKLILMTKKTHTSGRWLECKKNTSRL